MLSLVAPYEPAGDQPQAIAKLTEGLLAGAKHQVVLGVTGSGIYGKSSKGDFQVLSGSCNL